MRRAWVWVAGVAAVVLAGACSGESASDGVTTPEPETGWPAIARSLAEPFDASSPNVCTRGAGECLDAIIDEMTVRFDRLVATCDHAAPFTLAYLTTTRGLRDALRTADPASAGYLRHLDGVYARLFFETSDAWAAGRTTAVPAAWRRAFDAGDRRQITGLGDLLVGMNAHITRDLALAVASVGLTLPDGQSAKPAFDLVNAVLVRAQQPIMDELAGRFDPTIAQADVSRIIPAAAGAGSTVPQLLAAWRDEAWHNAGRLAAASAAERPAVAASIEAQADARGLSLVVATSYVPLLSSTASRDQHCSVNGRR